MMPQPGGMHQVPVPYVGPIPGGMGVGRRVTIAGTIPPTAVRFSVNLQCGPNTNPRDDIALHLNFRFDAQVPYVARNHLQMNQWGPEEGHGFLTVSRGQQFELHIDAEHDQFRIHVNGLHFTDFRYRLPVQRAAYLTIDGDVFISVIRLDGHATTHAPPPPYPGMAAPIVPPPGPAPYSVYPGASVIVPGVAPPPYPATTTRPYHATSSAIPVAMGMGTGLLAGAAVAHGHKKMAKKEKKMMKKMMKHHKPHKFHHKHMHHGLHGFHRKSSSSSSSSEEE